jgi:hypothetical protein
MEEWNNVAIATVKYHFLSLCIIIFKKKSVKKNKKNYKIIKIRTKKSINKSSVES